MNGHRTHTLVRLAVSLAAAALPVFLVAQSSYPPHGPTIAPVPPNGSPAVPYPTPHTGDAQSQWNMELAGWNDL
jgi:hypothetical protein